ncbi:HesA/MoeB/ThiF family protein [Trichlorobacter lovleyi]|uniref:HesA/MoeB/ThiF family protein n=1 Tax=Trichlorobacter lovleyi TaxID=313985 RepID=UPI0023F595DB|nr:HesA/MoeB/ThiF family protein [Trichlorobacter lovleyi]
MPEADLFIAECSDNGLLDWHWHMVAAEKFQLTLTQVERRALDLGIMPKRYQRNQATITVDDQLKLFKSHVAVIGCGGLGCYIVEELARAGIGTITVIDPDVFEEHNLNRQLFSTMANMGSAKVEVAASRVDSINPAVRLIPIQDSFNRANGSSLLHGADIAVDALDNIATRLELSTVCKELAIPFVFGTVAGWYGQVSTLFPGDTLMHTMYPDSTKEHGIEQQLGTPAFTPAVVASIEAVEVCKFLLGKKQLLQGRSLTIDLLAMEVDQIETTA